MMLLHDVGRMIRTEADRRARELGMTRAQWSILKRVSRHPGLSQRELAEILEVEPITVARLVDRLEKVGLVERRPDRADRRIWRLHLLDAATPVLAELDRQADQVLAILTGGFDEAGLAAVASAMRRMKDNLTLCRRGAAASDGVAEPAEAAV